MRKFGWPTFVAISLLTSAALAEQRQTAQQQFEAASDLLGAQNWGEAVAAFEALEKRVAAGKDERTLAVIRARKADGLFHLDRDEEAEVALRQALPLLKAGDGTVQEDRFTALVQLSGIAERRLDYGEALADYRLAETAAGNLSERARAISGAARTGMFFDPATALHDAERLLTTIERDLPDNKALRGSVRNLKGRILMNLGRFEEARLELKSATDELGGLTNRVDASDLSVRSDNAIAALLAGRETEARRFLAYTGAGRLDEEFGTGLEMVPPACGGEDDLRPEDVAVIEFSVLDNGSVGRATPVYSSRLGESAIIFAKAVSTWSWQPESVAKIHPLFRMLTRVELRCSTAGSRPSVTDLLSRDVADWLEDKGVPKAPDGGTSDAKAIGPLRTELARRDASSGDLPLAPVPVLIALADNSLVPAGERAGFLTRGFVEAEKAKAPAAVIAFLGMKLAYAKLGAKGWGRKRLDVAQLLARPDIVADPHATAAIELFLADYLYHGLKKTDEAIDILQRIRSSSLGAKDPIRIGALIRLASLNLVSDNPEVARSIFQETGIDEQQCALLDTMPRLKRHTASSGDYPTEALQWGFGGWAKIEYDITAEGKTTNLRAVAAYPPFVFDKASIDVLSRSQYDKSFRPGGGLGCTAASTPIHFKAHG